MGAHYSWMRLENYLWHYTVTGQAILDALEYAYRNTESISKKDGKPVGENGGFLQVSGLKFDVNLEIPSGVKTDANGICGNIQSEQTEQYRCDFHFFHNINSALSDHSSGFQALAK